MIVIVCGVSGTGKSTVGSLLASGLEIPFFDADDFHPQSNLEKMSSGIPLSDDDRKPWLRVLSEKLPEWQERSGAVLACSALKESYRKILSSKLQGDVFWIVLNMPVEPLKERINSREGHFFDNALLESQLEVFEIPEYGVVLNASDKPEVIVRSICNVLNEY